MKRRISLCLSLILAGTLNLSAEPLGLPPVPIPKDNPQSEEKIARGDKLFHDTRFSSTGEVSCSTCHVREKVFTDGLQFSQGIKKLTGTRNAPHTVLVIFVYQP